MVLHRCGKDRANVRHFARKWGIKMEGFGKGESDVPEVHERDSRHKSARKSYLRSCCYRFFW